MLKGFAIPWLDMYKYHFVLIIKIILIWWNQPKASKPYMKTIWLKHKDRGIFVHDKDTWKPSSIILILSTFNSPYILIFFHALPLASSTHKFFLLSLYYNLFFNTICPISTHIMSEFVEVIVLKILHRLEIITFHNI